MTTSSPSVTPKDDGMFAGTYEEAVARIALLERHLEIDRIYEASAEHEGCDCRTLTQAERDRMLVERLDGISCRDETIRLLEAQLDERRQARLRTEALLGRLAVMLGQGLPHGEILDVLTGADCEDRALADHRREAREQGWLLGLRDAHDMAASLTVRFGGEEQKPSRDDVLASLRSQIARVMRTQGCVDRDGELSFTDHILMLAKIGKGLTSEERRALAVHDRAEIAAEG
ncbi:hypothetical protein [Palleronia sp.]|uniref:hypothetical protein n=1 Tax=Palleronia sp. TaxID=1940284 RepID=UPI0035C78C51